MQVLCQDITGDLLARLYQYLPLCACSSWSIYMCCDKPARAYIRILQVRYHSKQEFLMMLEKRQIKITIITLFDLRDSEKKGEIILGTFI